MKIFAKILVVSCALLCAISSPLKAQVLDKGVTSSGKEVDCSTIDPSVDKTISEYGKIVTSPRVTRNGKLITTECGFVVTVTGDNSAAFCSGSSQSVTYTATVSAEIAGDGLTYKWYVNEVEQSSTTATMTYNYTTAGTYTVSCEVTKDAQTGEGQATTTVTVYAPPTVAISGNFVVCRTTPETLTATSGYSSYVWSNNVSSYSGNTAQVVNVGNYSVTVTDANNCTNSASQTVTVNNPEVVGNVTITGTTTICAGSGSTLTANATASTGATLNYQWYKDGVAISGATSHKLSTGNLSAGATYKCVVTATKDGCSSETKEGSTTITVNSPAVGTLAVTANPTTICPGEGSSLTASVTGNTGALSYQWYNGSTAISGATSSTYAPTNLNATTTYKCVVTATVGSCTATDNKSATVTVNAISVTTNNASNITCVTGQLNGSNSGTCATGRGFVYSASNSNPTIGGTNCTQYSASTGAGSYSYTLSGLTPDHTYYCKAYITAPNGTTYGSVKTFKTSAAVLTVTGDNTKEINLCQLPHTVELHYVAAVSCDAGNFSNYTWTLSPNYPYITSNGGKEITVTVTSDVAINSLTASCTATHTTGYTATGSKTSSITVTGNQPSVCICENSKEGTVSITGLNDVQSLVWKLDGVTKSTSTTGISISSETPEGFYTIEITSPLGCQASRMVALGYPFKRCASVGTKANTTEQTDGEGVYQITDSRINTKNPNAQSYRVVQIGGQCWLAENLRYVQPTDVREVSQSYLISDALYTTPISCKYNPSYLDESIFGTLYTWIGAMNTTCTRDERGTVFPYQNQDYHLQGVCPDGWHLPTDAEFFQLEKEMGVPVSDSAVVNISIDQPLDGSHFVPYHSRGEAQGAGTKAATSCYWTEYTAVSCPGNYCDLQRNRSGFSALPGGVYVGQYSDYEACFAQRYTNTNFWTATQCLSLHHPEHDYFSDAAITRHIAYNQGGWIRYRADKHNGMAVRCVRDNVTTLPATNATSSSITLNGIVNDDCDYPITSRGFCWNTERHPNISDNHIAVGAGEGSFSTTITSFEPYKTYFVCAYAVNAKGVYYGPAQKVTLLSAPRVETRTVSNIDNSSAQLNGYLVSDGGYSSTVRGICWGASANPDLSGNHQQATGSGMGTFHITVSGLPAATTIHYRAYAQNEQGTVYGADQTLVVNVCAGLTKISDYDGNQYNVGAIGSQCWTLGSMHATHYADGAAIEMGSKPASDVYSTSTPYYYTPYTNRGTLPADAAARILVWGYMYNWTAATRGDEGAGVQGICPNGWHVPTAQEWQTFRTYVNANPGASGSGAKAVSATNTWSVSTVPNTPGYNVTTNNSTGFCAYPTGMYAPSYMGTANFVNFWSSSLENTEPWYVAMAANYNDLNVTHNASNNKSFAFSVRCVKD